MVIEINNLVKRYKELTAVDHLNLQMREGEILGLLGPNGSGKSTTINCMLALTNYDKGEISVFGKKMTPNSYDIKRNIGVIPQHVAVFNELSVRENIEYFCSLYLKDKAETRRNVEEAIEFVGLENHEKMYPKKLSGGLLRRLNIACGIAHKPKLIIMDEPTVAVDPQSRNKILQGIVNLNKQGASILYTSHYMEEVEEICHRMAIMDGGKILAQGNLSELKSLIGGDEKITLEIIGDASPLANIIGSFDFVINIKTVDNILVAHVKSGFDAVMRILEVVKEKNIAVGKIYSELPTLNDVFLEITGKELRDNV